MSRRASLPGASELFRRTSNPVFGGQPAAETANGDDRNAGNGAGNAEGNGTRTSRDRRLSGEGAARRGSGRQKHDAKITVYVSGDELLAMEHARLALRGSHDLVVDRGRIVREAVAVLLADFDEHGEDSVLVQRLRADFDPEEAKN
ncbi:cobyrinic acid a,c-diamide synthase [Prauserella muralis]|uniref:Cobyrinic acid a,c-diamide synthase n=1 Tax=Prauserella muralis TaxID=588067 RepID=A0A2V4AJF1_9PSEU|nr:cobyrinic acid a,c-diamide synthase [Prauserella muralis]PXY19296.1 cobyrinic acid a,c-diamide synthase [Prauserella muralis]TWE29242.1 hypothetical protein FHX69_1920 [Prauserella muralis]